MYIVYTLVMFYIIAYFLFHIPHMPVMGCFQRLITFARVRKMAIKRCAPKLDSLQDYVVSCA